MKKLLYIFLFVFICGACGNREKDDLVKLVQIWKNRVIIFPNNLVYMRQGMDTVNRLNISNKYKILTYIDSVGCLSCKLQLLEWKKFIKQVRRQFSDSVCFLFFASPTQKTALLHELNIAQFEYPICIDEKDSLEILNGFPVNQAFQTFLLDEENRVVAIGNPIRNLNVKELYLKIIRGEKIERGDESKETRTKVEIDKTVVSLGSFDWQEEQKAAFVLKNTGDRLLVIQDVTTSCGCTTVAYAKEPVQPGGEVALEVAYKADHPEHFDKTVTVYCNAETSPLVLKIGGNAK